MFVVDTILDELLFKIFNHQTEGRKESDYFLSLVLTRPFGMLIPFSFTAFILNSSLGVGARMKD